MATTFDANRDVQEQVEALAQNPILVAIVALSERIRGLSKEDQKDLQELVFVGLSHPDREERWEAQQAMMEILDSKKVHLEPFPLPDEPGDGSRNWIAFVSKRIRDHRHAAGLTQKQLAEKSGVPQPHISRLEAGQHSPSGATLEKLASALGIPVKVFDPSAS